MSNIRIPELLAPAGSIDTLKASVNAGADAVYLSGERFGARQFAPNFNLKEMEEAIKYAHLRGVKVYITVNTLIHEDELFKVGDYLVQLYSIGADAVIVQDLGVASLAKKIVPDLNLHCSTQMTIHNPQGVSWAADNGFKRVILAREMSLEEVEFSAKANKNRKIELEVFAHGAICYSYSGQCLLSSIIGGRSGNRGMCAQPCRKNYQLVMVKTDKSGKYMEFEEIPLNDHFLLSTKDLAIYSHLEEVAKSSVDSIKIEGRMKPPEYVANVIKVYRDALNSLSKGKWNPSNHEMSQLKLCFNRGLTDGWIFNKTSSVMGRDHPGNRGLYLGQVMNHPKKQGYTVIKRKSEVVLEKGDGIIFKDPEKTGPSANFWGTILEHNPTTVKDNLFIKLDKDVKIGSDVFITRRKSMIHEAEEIVKNINLPHKIPLEIEIKWNETFTPLAKVTASPPHLENIKIKYKADFSMEKAIKKPLSTETISKHLLKTGGTPFHIRNVLIDYPGNLFTPISNLNHLRREILEEVQRKILKKYLPSSKEVGLVKSRLDSWKKDEKLDKKINYNDKLGDINLAIYVDSVRSFKAALELGCKKIYFQPKIEYMGRDESDDNFYCIKHSHDYETYFEKIHSSLKEVASLCNESDLELIWKWPDITSQNFIMGATNLLNPLEENTIDGVMVGNLGAMWSLKEDFSSVKIYGSERLNIWNHMATGEISKYIHNITLSPELSQKHLQKLMSNCKVLYPNHDFGFLIQGNLEAIVSKDCLWNLLPDKGIIGKLNHSCHLGIKDSKNRIFPVEIDQECRTHIFNSVELCLIDYLPQLSKMGLDNLIIDARNKPVNYIQNILPIYQKAREFTVNSVPNLGNKLDLLKKRVKKNSNGGITTGNFIRGVEND